MKAQVIHVYRKPTLVCLLPSLRVAIDKRRADTRQSLSDWVEEAVQEKLAKLARKGKS